MASFPRVPSALADVGIIVPGGGPFWSNPSHSIAGDRGTGKVWKVVKTPLNDKFQGWLAILEGPYSGHSKPEKKERHRPGYQSKSLEGVIWNKGTAET